MSGQQVRKNSGLAACKGCKRRLRMETLSASMLCGACLSEAFVLSWAKVTDAITWGASGCPECAIAGVERVMGNQVAGWSCPICAERASRGKEGHSDHQD